MLRQQIQLQKLLKKKKDLEAEALADKLLEEKKLFETNILGHLYNYNSDKFKELIIELLKNKTVLVTDFYNSQDKKLINDISTFSDLFTIEKVNNNPLRFIYKNINNIFSSIILISSWHFIYIIK